MYKRICQGLEDKGKLIPHNVSPYDYIDTEQDAYISVFYYNENHKKHWNDPVEKINPKTKEVYETIKGCEGVTDVETDWFVFDFDCKENLEVARDAAVRTVEKLFELGLTENDLLLTFSGNKGFGVEFKTTEMYSPKEVKTICKAIKNEAGIEGASVWDSKVYNSNRIMRIPFTKHQESGLYKIPLTFDELANESLANIESWASDKQNPEVIELIPIESKGLLEGFLIEPEKPKKAEKERFEPVGKVDLSDKPKWMSNWKYALQEGYFPHGSKNHALMILAATYKAQGWKIEHAYRILKGVAELQTTRYGGERHPDDRIWNEVVATVYSPTWQGGTYAEDNFPDEIVEHLNDLGIPRETVNEDEEGLIERVGDGFDGFAQYAKHIDEYTMKFGIDSLDNKLKCRKGHLIFVLAPPGVGKTSLGITMLNNMSKRGTSCYFGSYDMYRWNIYQKLLQKHTKMSEDDIFDVFKNEDVEQIQKFREILEREYSNVSFCFKVGQSIPDLKNSIRREELKRGTVIDLVVVDYLELVLTDVSDPTAASAEAAQGLREIANEGRVVVGLLQPNKMSSTPDEPITTYNAAKGSSTIAQAGTAILTCHRPGMSSANNNEDDHYFGINCVKNRNGQLFSLDFGWDGKTQTIYELDDAQRRELQYLRAQKEAQNAGGDDY